MTRRPTHMLIWEPGWLAHPPDAGAWHFQTWAEWESGRPADCPPEVPLPEDAGPREVAAWCGRLLGQPVALERREMVVSARLRPWRRELVPVWHVWPAGTHGRR